MADEVKITVKNCRVVAGDIQKQFPYMTGEAVCYEVIKMYCLQNGMILDDQTTQLPEIIKFIENKQK